MLNDQERLEFITRYISSISFEKRSCCGSYIVFKWYDINNKLHTTDYSYVCDAIAAIRDAIDIIYNEYKKIYLLFV